MKDIQKLIDHIKEEGKDDSTIHIAYYIALDAHKAQVRMNNDPYTVHPLGMLNQFDYLIYLSDDEETKLSIDNLVEYDIPFVGIREVILLHDVVEDTEYKHEDIAYIYETLGHKDYFDKYIDIPIRYITHKKEDDYEEYINKVLKNPASSLAKLLDLNNNLNLFGLSKFTHKEMNRAKKYLHYFKMINDRYHFVENIYGYRYDTKELG